MSNPEWKGLNVADLERLLQVKMGEVYRLRQEIDRRKSGGAELRRDVEFAEYVTEG